MHLSYQWKKDFFSNTYHICKENQLIGSLTSKSFSQISEGKLNGKSYTFVTRGFLNQNTDIIDSVSKKLIGQITYNSSMTKATITFADKTIHWKYDNAWNTKWSITMKVERLLTTPARRAMAAWKQIPMTPCFYYVGYLSPIISGE